MKKYLFSFTLLVCGLLFSSIAIGQVAGTNVSLKQPAINRCSIIEGNVDKRISNFEKQKTKHIAQYQKAQAKVAVLVTKLEGEGYDASQLKIDLVTFDNNIKKFSNDYATYIVDLKETKTYTCGRSEGEFKAKLAIARAQLKVVHDDSVAIHTYWAQTIKPEIEALKQTVVVPDTSTVEGSN